jgi:hypothetical protein
MRWIHLKYLMTLIWAILIGAALAYVLSSMAGDAFNLTQSLVFSVVAFIGISIMDAILVIPMDEKSN